MSSLLHRNAMVRDVSKKEYNDGENDLPDVKPGRRKLTSHRTLRKGGHLKLAGGGLAAILLLVACGGGGGGGEGSGDPIVIGALTPLTGGGGEYGPGMAEAMKIAVEDVNAVGGPMGRPLELKTEDSETDPNAAVNAARKLLDVNDVQAIMGTWSSAVSLAVAPLAIDAGVLEMNTSGAKELSELDDDDMVYRFQAKGALIGAGFAQGVKSQGWKTAVTLARNDPSALGNIEAFTEEFEADGGQVIEALTYNPEQSDYTSVVKKALAANADVIVNSTYTPEMTVLLKNWYQTGQDAKWLGPAWAVNETLAESVGEDVVEGVYAVDTVPNIESETYKALANRYEEATGKRLLSNIFAPMAYDMVISTAIAMEKCQCVEGPEVGPVVREVSSPPGEKVYGVEEAFELLADGKEVNYEGASSELDFDEAGDAYPTFGVYVMQSGQAELVETFEVQAR
jgi:branched-chain amino acid transport system substrate-binding protein